MEGWTIQLPKLVLARDLFFSHPYLLRAALFSERYTTDVLVDRDDTEAFHIFVAPNRKITAKDLKDPVFLKKLALILLHPELNQSFLSIYEKTIKNQAQSKAYDFDMDAPILKNIELDADGCIYSDSKITAGTTPSRNRQMKIYFNSGRTETLEKKRLESLL